MWLCSRNPLPITWLWGGFDMALGGLCPSDAEALSQTKLRAKLVAAAEKLLASPRDTQERARLEVLAG